jgi:hypothetical protein
MAIDPAYRNAAQSPARYHVAAKFDQSDLSLKHIHELVLVAVPVASARSPTRRQRHPIDAKTSKTGRFARALPYA